MDARLKSKKSSESRFPKAKSSVEYQAKGCIKGRGPRVEEFRKKAYGAPRDQASKITVANIR
jgi:hypothetical protein